MGRRIIAVDFDGCIVENKYPGIGPIIESTAEAIRCEKEHGSIIILWTCRVGRRLQEALKCCKTNDIPIDYCNENDPSMIKKFGGDCRKIYANEYWDDKAFRVSIDYIPERTFKRRMFGVGDVVVNKNTGDIGRVLYFRQPHAEEEVVCIKTENGTVRTANVSSWEIVSYNDNVHSLMKFHLFENKDGLAERYARIFAKARGISLTDAMHESVMQAYSCFINSLNDIEYRRLIELEDQYL